MLEPRCVWVSLAVSLVGMLLCVDSNHSRRCVRFISTFIYLFNLIASWRLAYFVKAFRSPPAAAGLEGNSSQPVRIDFRFLCFTVPRIAFWFLFRFHCSAGEQRAGNAIVRLQCHGGRDHDPTDGRGATVTQSFEWLIFIRYLDISQSARRRPAAPLSGQFLPFLSCISHHKYKTDSCARWEERNILTEFNFWWSNSTAQPTGLKQQRQWRTHGKREWKEEKMKL